ncbi:M20 metallopeptidase family protein [Tessaracoccus caeni]|uniref:M20 metallopeptidase family protein n=1 Tax=Tessaracoccus caeni TaxID=3031239 RepID=UPI0023DACFC1|nr:amidohydrolase [Tessaracoccus caeni]MDF1487291.1 amidohydrolase [Tessaracoccus caeni]
MNADLLNTLVSRIDAQLSETSSLRRMLHADPHLSGDEGDTRDAMIQAADWLDWIPMVETGAYARTGPDGPAVGLRAELDALPIHEATGVEWASQRRGIMHACGHDVHMAALWAVLSAARGLDLPVAMVPVLQPREESNPPGATDVVASGVLDDLDVRAMVGIHVQPQVKRGVVSNGSGPVNAAFDSFEITVTGRGGHGAYPHAAVDPIQVLAAIVSGLGDISARTINPIHPTVVSVGMFRAGTAANVIADNAMCRGSIRTYHESDRTALHDAIARFAEGTALARGAAATTQFVRGGPALVNDASISSRSDALLVGMGVPVATTPFRSCGSDDFSEYSTVMPSLMSFIGTGAEGGVGLHHAQFLPRRDALRLAAVTLATNYVAAADTILTHHAP